MNKAAIQMGLLTVMVIVMAFQLIYLAFAAWLFILNVILLGTLVVVSVYPKKGDENE